MNGSPPSGSPSVVVRRAAERFVTPGEGLVSRHSFSFGSHYDPHNVGFGVLVVSNDDLAEPGAGYDTHPHRDVEIVTWVLDGALVHRDSTGGGGVVTPGLAQRMSAGRGVLHSEFNDAGFSDSGSSDGAGTAGESTLRFVQMWVPPGESGGEPSYEQRDVAPDLAAGRLVTVASGLARDAGSAAVRIAQPAAAMHVARPDAGASVTLPNAPFVHVYVARGSVELESVGRLDEGDAARLTDEGGRRIVAHTPAEVVVWEMHASLYR